MSDTLVLLLGARTASRATAHQPCLAPTAACSSLLTHHLHPFCIRSPIPAAAADRWAMQAPPRRQQPAAADAHPTPSPHPRSRRRQIDYAAALSGPAPAGSSLPVVGPDDIEAIVASWTGVPVERMSEDESARLAGLVRA